MASVTYTGAAPPSRLEHRERELSDARRAELADDFARRMGARGEALVRDAAGAASRRAVSSVRGAERAGAVDPSVRRALSSGSGRVASATAPGTPRHGTVRERVVGGGGGGAIGGHCADPSGEPSVPGRESRGATDAERTSPGAFDDPLCEALDDDGSLEAEHALVEASRGEEALERAEEIDAESGRDEHEGCGAAALASAVLETAVPPTPIGAGADGAGEGGGGKRRTGELVQDLAERLVERLDELALADSANVDGPGGGSGEESDVWRFTLEHDVESLDFAVARRATGEFVVALSDGGADGALAELGERLAAIDPGIVLERVEEAR